MILEIGGDEKAVYFEAYGVLRMREFMVFI
jgi:hypothetical protein